MEPRKEGNQVQLLESSTLIQKKLTTPKKLEEKKLQPHMKIAVAGGGWSGCHVACVLSTVGYDVTLYEKNSDIFNGISGEFGIRLHSGLHYPRSPKTRQNCREGFNEFLDTYPELVIQNSYSIYGLGDKDADGNPSKITLEEFKTVKKEFPASREINPSDWGYQHLLAAIDINEPSIAVGERLRSEFWKYLKKARVKVICNYKITEIKKSDNKITITNGISPAVFDYLINATSFHALLPKQVSLPFDMEVRYQPCLALVYKDKLRLQQPSFSFIAIDGMFPCMMPLNANKDGKSDVKLYAVTHGKWTILGSCATFKEANDLLAKMDDKKINGDVRPKCEKDMKKFWPGFGERFEYVGWKGTVLSKIKTIKEFRSTVVFESDLVIHIFPGKISGVFQATREVLQCLNGENILQQGSYKFVKNGVLHDSIDEITEKPGPTEPNTCNLNTYRDHYESPSESSESKITVIDNSFFNDRNSQKQALLDKSPVSPPLRQLSCPKFCSIL